MRDGWKKVAVEDIARVLRGASPRPKGDPRYYGGNIPRLMGADVSRDGRYVTPCIDFLTEEGAKLSRPMPKGTLTIVCSGDVGTPSFLAVDACIHDGFLAVVDVNEECELDYLYEVFEFLKVRLERSATHGGVFTNLTTEILRKFQFLLPTLPEQKAIADLLSTWDEAIEKTERLIHVKEIQKLAELRSLISSHKANSTIGSFVKPVVRKVDKPTESYVALGIRSHFKGTFQRIVDDPKTVNMDSLYRVKENDLIVNITFAWEGAIALVKKEDESCYVSHRFPTYEIKRTKAEPCFIRQLIMSSRMKYDLSNISPGGAGRNRVLNKKDFLNMPIWLPNLETQRNIGKYLGEIDQEINLLKQLVEKYKTQKRGLMQKMLTGEWRVKDEIISKYREI